MSYLVFCIVIVLLQRLVYCRFITIWCFSSSCCDTLYLNEGDSDKQNGFNHLKISDYSNHYNIKFISCMSIYYIINMDIFSSFMIFSNLYLGSINLLQI